MKAVKCIIATILCAVSFYATTAQVVVDANEVVGKIKVMNAVNNGPQVPPGVGQIRSNAQAYKDAGFGYARLHDAPIEWEWGHTVDISCIFPDFSADEKDPKSYDFTLTDKLIKEIYATDTKVFYRLGQSIEHWPKKYGVNPPADFKKWARICEHIIMHYNEGWANGFHMDIEYWEIWNEPDNDIFNGDNQCWKGTKEQFFELYRVASIYLKEKFPHLKIGGYASSGFYALTNTFIKAANSSPRKEYFLEFFEDFLAYSKKNGCILDFFSWHSYASVERNVVYRIMLVCAIFF